MALSNYERGKKSSDSQLDKKAVSPSSVKTSNYDRGMQGGKNAALSNLEKYTSAANNALNDAYSNYNTEQTMRYHASDVKTAMDNVALYRQRYGSTFSDEERKSVDELINYYHSALNGGIEAKTNQYKLYGNKEDYEKNQKIYSQLSDEDQAVLAEYEGLDSKNLFETSVDLMKDKYKETGNVLKSILAGNSYNLAKELSKGNDYNRKQELYPNYEVAKNEATAIKLQNLGVTEEDIQAYASSRNSEANTSWWKINDKVNDISNALTSEGGILNLINGNVGNDYSREPAEKIYQLVKDGKLTEEELNMYIKSYVGERRDLEYSDMDSQKKQAATMVSFATNPFESSYDVAKNAYNYATGKPLTSQKYYERDEEGNIVSGGGRLTDTLREKSQEGMNNVEKWFYNQGVSIGDEAVALGLSLVTHTNIGSVIQGIEKADSVINESVDRNLTPNQIILMGAASGVTTAVTENLVKGKLAEIADKGLTEYTLKELFKVTLASSYPEAKQEVEEELADYLVDVLVAGDKNKFNTNLDYYKEQYIAQGQDEYTAIMNALKDVMLETAAELRDDAIGGAIGGLIFGGMTNASHYVNRTAYEANRNQEISASIKNNNAYETLNAEAENLKDKKAVEHYNKVIEATNGDLSKASDKQIATIYDDVMTQKKTPSKEILARYSKKEQQEIIDGYKKRPIDLDFEDYVNIYDEVRRAGASGDNQQYYTKESDIAKALGEKLSASAYLNGANETIGISQKTSASLDKAIKEMDGNFKKGSFTSKVDYNSLNSQKRAFYKFAEGLSALGLNIEVIDDASATSKNGEFNSDKNSVMINLSARHTVNFDAKGTSYVNSTFSHELTHYIEQNANEAYKVLYNAVKRGMQSITVEGGTAWDSAYSRQYDAVKADNPNADEEFLAKATESEIIARACEDMLSDNQRMVDILANTDAKSRNQIKNAIIKFFNEMKDMIKKILGTYESDAAEAKYIRQIDGLLDEMREAWMDGFVQAVERQQISEKAEKAMEETGIASTENNDTFVRNSVKYTLAEQYEQLGYKSYKQAVEECAKEISKKSGIDQAKVEKWIRAEESIAALILAEGNEVLNYTADDRYKAIKKNADYKQGTVDLSNLCRKREIFTKMFDNLQRENPDVLFTADDIAVIRQALVDSHYEVACALCYVEDRRQKMGEIAENFIGFYKEALKSDTKSIYKLVEQSDGSIKKTGLFPTKYQKEKYGLSGAQYKANDPYVPNQYDLVTYEGFKKLQEEHPMIAYAFERYNNSRGMASARVIEGHAEYAREILGYSQKQIDAINAVGGLRVFSFSDFEAIHLIDICQVIVDCAKMGVKIQTYTKVPEFAALIRNTGVKANRSLIPANVGSENAYARIVDKNGKQKFVKVKPVENGIAILNGKRVLAFDNVEGIDVTSKYFLDETDNADIGNILIGMSNEQIELAMADPFIDYIIPFHTGQKKSVLHAKGIADWKNFKDVQLDKKLPGSKSKNKEINIYKDVLDNPKYSITTIKEFEDAFLNECKEQGFTPRFSEFVGTDGYYKVLLDFKLFDKNGNIVRQNNVVPDIDTKLAKKILLEGKSREEQTKFSKEVMDDVKGRLAEKGKTLNSSKLEDVGYHAGDLGKAESLGIQGYGRDTGHFGTGTYFVGNEQAINIGGYKERPHEKVDFSKYNMYKPSNSSQAYKLHDLLRGVDGFYNLEENVPHTQEDWERRKDELDEGVYNGEIPEEMALEEAITLFGEREIAKYAYDNAKDNLPENIWMGFQDGQFYLVDQTNYGVRDITKEEALSYINFEDMISDIVSDNRYAPRWLGNIERYYDTLNDYSSVLFGKTASQIESLIKEVRDDINNSKVDPYVSDSAATRLMKKLGYEGIDVRGTDLDNTAYGSVIYDLKAEDLARKKEIGTARFSSKVDADGNTLTAKQIEFFKDSKLRDDNGNLIPVYHGSPDYGFTVFNPKYSDDKRSLFFTDSKEVANGYRGHMGKGDVYKVYLNLTNPLIIDAKGEYWNKIASGEVNVVDVKPAKYGDYIFLNETDSEEFSKKYPIEKFKSYLDDASENGEVEIDGDTYDYYDLKDHIDKLKDDADKEYRRYHYNNSSTITAREFFDNYEKYSWYDLANVINALDSNGSSYEELKENYEDNDFAKAVNDVKGLFEENDSNNGASSSAFDLSVNVIPTSGSFDKTEHHNTRGWSQKAFEEGYDGVIFKNVSDTHNEGYKLSTVAVAFNSNQIKLTTNEHPTENNDIRYSSKVDAEYMSAVESGDETKLQKMVDDSALLNGAKHFPNDMKSEKYRGKPIPYYHGTNYEFNSFDIDKSTDGNHGYGFYVSPVGEFANRYGKRLIKSYIMTDNLADNKMHKITSEMVMTILDKYNIPEERRGGWLWLDEGSLEGYLDAVSDRIVMHDIEKEIFRDTSAKPSEVLKDLQSIFGYDGMVVNRETILFDNTLIKSADPITYDDNGNVIPLSERFNSNSGDIRYSSKIEGGVGININRGGRLHYVDKIFDKDETKRKIVETRPESKKNPGHGTLWEYVGKRVGIVETGRSGYPAMLRGYATIVEEIKYANVKDFRDDYDRHFVAEGSKYDIEDGGVKYGYVLTDIEELEEPVDVSDKYVPGDYVSRPLNSSKIQDTTYDILGESDRLNKENAKLKKDIENLVQAWKLDKTVTDGKVLDKKYLYTVANSILKQSNSTYNKEDLVTGLKDVYGYILENKDKENFDWNVVSDKISSIASNLVAEHKDEYEIDKHMKLKLKDMRSTSFSLTEEQKQELGSDWNKRMFGKCKIDNNARSLDAQWAELANEYGLNPDTPSQQMAEEWIKTYDTMKELSETLIRFNETEAIREVSRMILDKAWNVPTITTTADKYTNKIKELKAEHRKTVDELNKSRKEAVEKQKLADAMYYGHAIEKLRQRRDERIAEIKQHNRDMKEKQAVESEKRLLIGKITKTSVTLIDWINNPSKTHRVPDVLKIPTADLLNAIDFSSKQLLGMVNSAKAFTPTKKDMKLSTALADMNIAVTKLMNSQADGDFELDLPEDYSEIIDSLKMVAERLESKANGNGAYVLQHMSVEDLNELNKMVTILKKSISTVNKLIASANAHSVDEPAQEIMYVADKRGKKKYSDNPISKFLESEQITPYYFFDSLGAGGKEMFTELMDGWDKFARNVEVIKAHANEAWTEEEVKAWEKDIREFDVVQYLDIDGKPVTAKVKMTVPQMMSLYCLMKREQAVGHILANGITISSFKDGNHTTSQQRTTITKESVGQIIASLTDRQKEVADSIQTFMNTVCSDWGNEVSNKRWGIKAFTEDTYFPIVSDSNSINKEARDREQSIYGLLNMSFTKQLTKGANNKIMLGNIFDTYTTHTSDMAKYNSIALPVLDMIKVLNYKEKIKTEGSQILTRGVRDALEESYGQKTITYINQFLKDLNGASESRAAIPEKLLRNYKAAAVGANIQVAALQPISYIRAICAIDAKYLTKAMMRKPQIKKCKEKCGIAMWKSNGFFDTNISRGLDKIIKHNDSVYEKAIEKSMWLAGHMDDVTWGYLYNACEDWVSDNTSFAKGTEEFDKAVNDKFRDVIYRTQVVDSTMTRSQIMRSKNVFNKLASAFMSEPTISYNIAFDVFKSIQNDMREGLTASEAIRVNGQKFKTAVISYTAATAVEAVLRGVVSEFRNPADDDDDDDTLLKRILEQFASEINPLSKIPYVKDGFEILSGNTASKVEYSGIQNLYYAWKSWIKNGFSYKSVYRSLQAASQLSGVPASSGFKDIIAMWNWVVKSIGREDLMFK